MSDSVALEHLNTVRGYVMSELQLRRTTLSVNVTDGTREYALNAYAYCVNQVRYTRSSTQGDFKVLRAISLPELDMTQQDWRKVDDGEPSAFYLYNGTTGPIIGLDRAVDTTTSSGYPILSVDVNQNNVLSSGDVLYDDMPNTKVYVYGIRREFAEDMDNANVAAWDELFGRELDRVHAYLQKKNAGYSTVMRPSYMYRRSGVI